MRRRLYFVLPDPVSAEVIEKELLLAKIDDLAEADDIFTKLMGDVVEPRREFIQSTALDAVNLDI